MHENHGSYHGCVHASGFSSLSSAFSRSHMAAGTCWGLHAALIISSKEERGSCSHIPSKGSECALIRLHWFMNPHLDHSLWQRDGKHTRWLSLHHVLYPWTQEWSWVPGTRIDP